MHSFFAFTLQSRIESTAHFYSAISNIIYNSLVYKDKCEGCGLALLGHREMERVILCGAHTRIRNKVQVSYQGYD